MSSLCTGGICSIEHTPHKTQTNCFFGFILMCCCVSVSVSVSVCVNPHVCSIYFNHEMLMYISSLILLKKHFWGYCPLHWTHCVCVCVFFFFQKIISFWLCAFVTNTHMLWYFRFCFLIDVCNFPGKNVYRSVCKYMYANADDNDFYYAITMSHRHCMICFHCNRLVLFYIYEINWVFVYSYYFFVYWLF